MQRAILLSSIYRQTSLRTDARANAVDPRNNLLWRFRRRRLEGEAIRDSVLAVSGRLNLELGGLPFFPRCLKILPNTKKSWAKSAGRAPMDRKAANAVSMFSRDDR